MYGYYGYDNVDTPKVNSYFSSIIVFAGEALCVPKGWWCSTRSLSPSLCLSAPFVISESVLKSPTVGATFQGPLKLSNLLMVRSDGKVPFNFSLTERVVSTPKYRFSNTNHFPHFLQQHGRKNHHQKIAFSNENGVKPQEDDTPVIFY